ncbi:MAG: flagellar basal body rod protein FlgC [Syntrophales bacterium]|jgi:flagellar basal-body rod protein FlgC|nr:flagellar basal body rod protein FlgC [Syntrophales bacterium]MDY0043096.1 flagellar basal body rod protein FlgC [Syntrophales bacterium]
MDFSNTFRICASGFSAQRKKIDVIVNNLANIHTTRSPEGGPYKRQTVVLGSEPVEDNFGQILDETLQRVTVKRVVRDEGGVKMIFDPTHPDADTKGFVAMPDINSITEMSDMIMAHRAYEACVTAFDATKNMVLKTMEMGK